jgi:hypothetical protein
LKLQSISGWICSCAFSPPDLMFYRLLVQASYLPETL